MDHEKKTVFVTGASSGIGLETALLFLEHDWNVVATMRRPQERSTSLHDKGSADLLHLDVTDPASIRHAVLSARDKYGRIDVLVNNAGYALYGPFEAATRDQIARQFDTNVLGLMEVVREVLPVLRQQRGGVIINVASMGGRIGFPLYSIYDSSKWAVEGFTEALQYELKPLNIKVKLIEPGVIKTDFYNRSLDSVDCGELAEDYAGILKRTDMRSAGVADGRGAEPRAVAERIYRAATDGSQRLRYVVGSDARLVSAIRRLAPDRVFCHMLEKATLD
jgi:NAD(P)-dependent dehydrogenase (short-subunit alcohol dehydrogenase family)